MQLSQISVVMGVAAVGAAIALTSCDDGDVAQCGIVDVAETLPESQVELFEALGYGSLESVRACEIGPYIVYLYREDSDAGGSLLVRHPDESVVWVQPNGGISLAAEGQLFLNVDDQNDDGRLDWLSYEVYREEPAGSLVIIDNNLDGQANTRFERVTGEKHKTSLWFDGSWRPIQWPNGPEPNRILVDGVWSLYKVDNGTIVLVDDDE